MYSTMALPPLASDIARCRVARRSSPGTPAVTTRSGVSVNAPTASATVAKLSSAYCAQTAGDIAGRPPLLSGYCDSASHNKFAASPASFTPSVAQRS